jgi:hypothetical protein
LRFPAVRWVLTTLTAALLLGADASSPPEWAYPLNPSKPKPPLEIALTRTEVAALRPAQMRDLVAYVASLPP